MARSIEFLIPGIPEVLIQAAEGPDGTLLFTATVQGNADLRGLFFDIAGVDAALTAAGADVTDQDMDTINLGGGVNMNGGGRDDYDMGIEFGTSGAGHDLITSTSFTLSSVDGTPLTLDAIANVEFGVRLTSIDGSDSAKNTVIAPAAPDAIDDVAGTLEDEAVTIDATSNDTDADADMLTITSVDDPVNGTTEIIGNQIVFTPDENWAGTETFSYMISDGNGGKDCAEITVTVEAVADAPLLSVEALAGANVQEVILQIDSALVDTDGSESMMLEISGLPAGVTASRTSINNPGATEFITITLPEGQDFDFGIEITATTTEELNGDMASTMVTQDIMFDYTLTEQTVTLEANDQSQWGEGDEFTFDDERDLGFDTGRQSVSDDFLGGVADYTFAIDLAAGLRSDLHFGGGEIDADVPYDLTFETAYNETTDVLQLDTAAMLAAGGGFFTDGPELTYTLDFYIDFFAQARLGIDVGPIDANLINTTISTGGEQTVNVIDFDSDTSPSLGVDLPLGFSGEFTWPNLNVDGTEGAAGSYSGSGASNNFLDVNLDVDQLLADVFLGGVNPLDLSADITVADQTAFVGLDILDVDLMAGANFLQDFDMEVGDLSAMLVFEDGSEQAFTFGDTFVFEEASTLDLNGDGDIEFEFVLDIENTQVTNDTDVGFNVGWSVDALTATAGYDTLLGSDSVTIGPLVDLGQSEIPVASLDVYSDTFVLDFEETSTLLVA